MIYLLDGVNAADCGGLLPILRLVYNVINLLRIVIPIALILLGTIDLGKAVIASDEKEIKSAQSLLIKRLIYAAVIFFVPTIVVVVMNLVTNANTENGKNITDRADNNTVSTSTANDFSACWNAIVQ